MMKHSYKMLNYRTILMFNSRLQKRMVREIFTRKFILIPKQILNDNFEMLLILLINNKHINFQN